MASSCSSRSMAKLSLSERGFNTRQNPDSLVMMSFRDRLGRGANLEISLR